MRDWNTISSAYRPLEGDVLHPDECVVIRIMGQDFRVRPLQLPRGVRYIPAFSDGGVSYREIVDPLGNKPMQDRARALIEYIESEHAEEFAIISEVCKYVSGLLDQQYDIADDVKEEMFSFCGGVEPIWLQQGIRHAYGLAPLLDKYKDAVLALQDAKDEEPEPKPSRWKFWKWA